jgi:hypothetical protein
VVLSTTNKLALVLVAVMALGVAQDPPKPADAPKPADKPQKVAKDTIEADLINSIPKTTDPAQKIKILDEWTAKYPETAFETERQAEYLNDYTALKDCRNASKVSSKILSSDPNNELALRTIITCIYSIKDPDASEMQTAEKAANYLVDHAGDVYSAAKMPAGVAAGQWEQVKNAMVLAARNVTPQIDIIKKDNPKAEADLTKVLQAEPSDVQASLMFANVLFNQRQADPKKQPPAIFEFARVGSYTGPNSLPAAQRPAYVTAATKYYGIYHGSNEGVDKMLALAATNALPPADWTIESTADIAMKKAKEDEERDKADPVGTIWRTVHDGLTGDGDAMFWDSVKDTGLPSSDGATKFKGKLVSFKPAIGNPKTLVIAVKDQAGDVTLQLEMPLRGKMDPGAELEFWGTAKAYTKSPYMLTLDVADPKTDIVGWKPVAAPPARGRGPAPKKTGQQ